MAFEFTVDKNQFRESSCFKNTELILRHTEPLGTRKIFFFNHHFELRITFWDCFNKTAGCHEKIVFFLQRVENSLGWQLKHNKNQMDLTDETSWNQFCTVPTFLFFILDVNWWLQFFGSFQLNKITAFFFLLQCEQHDWQITWTFVHFLQSSMTWWVKLSVLIWLRCLLLWISSMRRSSGWQVQNGSKKKFIQSFRSSTFLSE